MYFRILCIMIFSVCILESAEIASNAQDLKTQFLKNFEDKKDIKTRQDLIDNIFTIERKIHELKKEKYLLNAKNNEKYEEKINKINLNNKSGLYANIGLGLTQKSESVDSKNTFASTFGVGYMKYYIDDVALKFGIYGIYAGNYEAGYNMAILKDFMILKNNYFGIFLGMNIFTTFKNTNNNSNFNISTNFNFGCAYSFLNHHRIELSSNFGNKMYFMSYYYIF